MTMEPDGPVPGESKSRTAHDAPADFGPFLFAPVWVESGGRTLTVLLALARLKLDPWDEARRLAGLTRPDAAHSLARSLTVLRLGMPWVMPQPRRIAARLVALLPAEGGSGPPPLAQPDLVGRQATRHRAIALAMAGVVAGLALLLAGRQAANLYASAAASPPPGITAGHP